MGTATGKQARSGAPARSSPSTAGRGRTTGPGEERSRARPAPAKPRQRPSTGAAPRPASRRRPAPRAPRMPFVLLVLGLLGGALVSLLALRTVLIEDAFAISQLQQENQELTEREEELREEVIHMESSERIAEEAEELGMEPGEAPLFLDVESGEITGEGGSDPEGAGPR